MHIQVNRTARRAVVIDLSLPDWRIDYRPFCIIAARKYYVPINIAYRAIRDVPTWDAQRCPR